jgi:hypothetical protein
MEWTLEFDTQLIFLEDYYNLITAEDLALELMERDLTFIPGFTMTQTDNCFRRVVEDIVANDDWVQQFRDSWNKLSDSVWDCCIASPHIVPDLESCMEVTPHGLFSYLLNHGHL